MSRQLVFDRVVVVLDVTCDHCPALDSAAAVAARLGAELVAIFVEDSRLVALEEHPLARGISLPTGLCGSIEPGSIQRGSRALACRARRRLARLSHQFGLDVDFEFLSGDITSGLRKRGRPQDLFVVESGGRALVRHVRMASRGPSMAALIPGPVLFVGGQVRHINSVVIVYDGSKSSQRGLDTAMELSLDMPVMLTALLVDDVDAQKFETEVRQKLAKRGARIRLHTQRMTARNAKTIIAAARRMHANLVIVSATANFPNTGDIAGLHSGVNCPVLILRGDGGESDEAADDKSACTRR